MVLGTKPSLILINNAKMDDLSRANRVMHSDVFKAKEDWTKSQQNDLT